MTREGLAGGGASGDSSGQGMIEYALMVGLVSLITVAIFVMIGGELTSQQGVVTESIGSESIGEHQATLSVGLF